MSLTLCSGSLSAANIKHTVGENGTAISSLPQAAAPLAVPTLIRQTPHIVDELANNMKLSHAT